MGREDPRVGDAVGHGAPRSMVDEVVRVPPTPPLSLATVAEDDQCARRLGVGRSRVGATM